LVRPEAGWETRWRSVSCPLENGGIFRINPDGGRKQQLTEDSGGGAAVSPDGRRIAYWSQADGDFETYVVNADGTGKRQLTKNRGNDALPTWSPNSRVIYYSSDQNSTEKELQEPE
jgi:Tol biopolymer transport system component